MALADDLAALVAQSSAEQTAREAARRQPPKHPSGWEPGVTLEGTTGTVTAGPFAEQPKSWDELLAIWELDPAQYEIVEPVQVRAWDAAIGNGETRRMRYYRATVVTRTSSQADITDLLDEIRRHKPRKPAPTGDLAFVVCIADTQLGKADGDGTRGIVDRFMTAIDSVEQRVRELRKIGRPLGTLYVLGMGDLIENCDGHYAQQAWRTELNLRDQVKVMRRLVLKALGRWSPHFERVVVAAIGGNHGEHRKDGKSFTDFADNHDVAIFEQVADVLAANPDRYGHVSFVLPNDSLTLTLDMAGVTVGLAHGHQARKGSSPQEKNLRWWAGQAHGLQPVGDATLLLTGHYHHLAITEDGAKTHIQAPSLDGGSDWFKNVTGQDARPGLLTFVVGNGRYQDVQVV